MQIKSNNIDSVLNITYKKILKHGTVVNSTQGSSKEIIGTTIVLENPLSRISSSENRGKIFTALGELIWYLSGRDDYQFISHYIKKYQNHLDPGKDYLNGAYGKRVFSAHGSKRLSLFYYAQKKLIEKNDSRQIVIPIYRPNDLIIQSKDIPCTLTFQFLKRKNTLSMIVNMRSNDAYIGLPHDIFCFTMIQEIMARLTKCELGEYIHNVGSLHIYENDVDKVNDYLDNSNNKKNNSMPRMPDFETHDNPLKTLIEIENNIRNDKEIDLIKLNSLNGFKNLNYYWKDLCRLILFHKKNKETPSNLHELQKIKSSINNEKFSIFTERVIKKKFQNLNDQLELFLKNYDELQEQEKLRGITKKNSAN